VEWTAVVERLGGGRAIVAVDVAKHDFVAAVLDEEARVLARLKWTHPEQTGEVLGEVRRLAQVGCVEAVLEPSGTYGDALVWQLRQAGATVYRVSPKRVHDVAEVYDGVPSLHDAKASELIGRLHLQGISQRWEPPALQRRELNAWLSRLGVCKARQQAAYNRLEAQLSRHWPEVLELLSLESVSLSELVAAYGDPAAVAADAAGVRALLRRVGRGAMDAGRIEALLASARSTLGVPCTDAERSLLQWLGGELNAARREVQAGEAEVQRRVGASPELARLGAVIGEVSAAVLVAALGAAQSYPSAAGYLKAAGLNLKERSSGKHKGRLKITKRGPGLVRLYLYFAALRLIRNNPVVRAWFTHKTSRPGALKGKSVVELMRKLTKALWHVGRGAGFDARRLFSRETLAA
jgi:transposase